MLNLSEYKYTSQGGPERLDTQIGFEPHSDFQVSKKQNVSSPLTRNYLILWGASMTER